MTLPINLLAIISNTFTETLRQPIYGVVLAATIGILILSPSLVMFTLDDDNQLLKDTGHTTACGTGRCVFQGPDCRHTPLQGCKHYIFQL